MTIGVRRPVLYTRVESSDPSKVYEMWNIVIALHTLHNSHF